MSLSVGRVVVVLRSGSWSSLEISPDPQGLLAVLECLCWRNEAEVASGTTLGERWASVSLTFSRAGTSVRIVPNSCTNLAQRDPLLSQICLLTPG